MGNSNAKQHKAVLAVLESLFDKSPRKSSNRKTFVEKIWKLVDPKKSGILNRKRATMLVRALMQYCKRKAGEQLAVKHFSKTKKTRQLMGFSLDSGDEDKDRSGMKQNEPEDDYVFFQMVKDEDLQIYVQNFIQLIDLDSNGDVTEREFRIWISKTLNNPFQALKEIIMPGEKAINDKHSTSHTKSPSMNRSGKELLNTYRNQRRKRAKSRRESAEFDKKQIDTSGHHSLLEETKFIHEMKLYDLCHIAVETPYGNGHIIDEEKDRTLAVHYHWGGRIFSGSIGYFRSKVTIDPDTGESTTTYPGVRLALSTGNPGMRMPPDELTEELNLHRELGMETVHDGLIRKLSEGQLRHYLQILLRKPYKALLQRLSNPELLRRAFWVVNSNPEQVDGSYIEYVTSNAPTIQKQNTLLFFRDHIKDAEEKMTFNNLEIFCPLFPSRRVKRVEITKRFCSGHGPMLLNVDFHGLSSLPVKVIYKPDECRADAACLTMFKVFNRCWDSADMKLTPYAYSFEVCPLGPKSGMIEFIENAVELQVWDCAQIAHFSKEDLDEFVRSAAGSYVACYIMGCRDRHKSNFMIKDSRTFLQIDFKHCFDRQTRGVDAPHFSVQRGMKKCLKERNMWQPFKALCQEAFRILRRRSQLLIQICLQAFRGLWFSDTEMETWLIRAFRLSETEEVAVAAIPRLINEGVSSIQRKLKSWTHNASLARHLRKKSKGMSGDFSSWMKMPSLDGRSSLSNLNLERSPPNNRRNRFRGNIHTIPGTRRRAKSSTRDYAEALRDLPPPVERSSTGVQNGLTLSSEALWDESPNPIGTQSGRQIRPRNPIEKSFLTLQGSMTKLPGQSTGTHRRSMTHGSTFQRSMARINNIDSARDLKSSSRVLRARSTQVPAKDCDPDISDSNLNSSPRGSQKSIRARSMAQFDVINDSAGSIRNPTTRGIQSPSNAQLSDKALRLLGLVGEAPMTTDKAP